MPPKQLTPTQAAAMKARMEAAAVSPSVAQNLGDPMGNTFDFAPDDIPRPGTAPGGAPQGGVQPTMHQARMSDASPLPDDRDQLVAQGMLDQAPPPAEPKVHRGNRPPEHPLLRKLRQDLGIETSTHHEVKIGGHVWRMTALSAGDTPALLRLVDKKTETWAEHQTVYNTLLGAHSVVAIDGVPTYQLFGVEPGAIPIADPFRPPRVIRLLATERLYEFIVEGKGQLAQRVFEAYLDKCEPDSTVESYLDDPANKKMKFRCEKCGEATTLVPRRKPGTNDVILPFCQWDAIPMTVESEDPLA